MFSHNKGWYHPRSPCRFQTKISCFSFHTSLFKKALLSHFLGQQRGYPRMIFMFVPLPRLSQVQYSCKTLKMLTATNMDPQNKGFVFLSQKKVETNDAKATRRAHLDPDGRGGVALACCGQSLEAVSKTFHTSPQSRSYPCLTRMVPYCFYGLPRPWC